MSSFKKGSLLLLVLLLVFVTSFLAVCCCPSATLKRNLNINESARTVMASDKYTIGGSMECHGCPPAQASVSPFHAFQTNHDRCHSNQASACVPKILQAREDVFQVAFILSAAPQDDGFGNSSGFLAMTNVVPFESESTIPLHALSSSVTIPQPLFPKNQVLRI